MVEPIGTASALTARGTAYTLTVAFFKPLLAAGTTAGLAGGQSDIAALTAQPKFIHWLARAETIPPAKGRTYAQRLMTTAEISRSEQFFRIVT